MKKEYFLNLDYNRRKRRSTLTLSLILVLMIGCMASIFISMQDYVFALVFSAFLILPIYAIPSGFKNYPLHNKPVVKIGDGEIVINDKLFSVKDVSKLIIIVELPSSKIASKDIELLNKLKVEYPTDDYFGTFDVVYYDVKGKRQTEYCAIDHVIDALYTMIDNGFKNYELKFTIKKNTVINECDLKKRKEEVLEDTSLKKISKKQRTRQLI